MNSGTSFDFFSFFPEKVAIKILDKTKLDQKTQRLLSREISSMEKLHHPNIIRLYEVVETLSKLHLVMEYAGGGELFGKISTEGKFSEPESKLIFSQIVRQPVPREAERAGGAADAPERGAQEDQGDSRPGAPRRERPSLGGAGPRV